MKYVVLILINLFFINCKKNNSIEITDTKLIIGILPYNKIEQNKIDSIKICLEQFYHCKIKELPELNAPKSAFINVKSARYRADSLIKFQKKLIKEYEISHILGLCNFDISTTKKKQPFTKYQDWGIMGLAYCPGNSSIISTFRLKNKNKKLFFERYKKVTVHEFGHNLGLPHCKDKKCVMTDAIESIKTIDNAELKLCKNCSKKLNL